MHLVQTYNTTRTVQILDGTSFTPHPLPCSLIRSDVDVDDVVDDLDHDSLPFPQLSLLVQMLPLLLVILTLHVLPPLPSPSDQSHHQALVPPSPMSPRVIAERIHFQREGTSLPLPHCPILILILAFHFRLHPYHGRDADQADLSHCAGYLSQSTLRLRNDVMLGEGRYRGRHEVLSQGIFRWIRVLLLRRGYVRLRHDGQVLLSPSPWTWKSLTPSNDLALAAALDQEAYHDSLTRPGSDSPPQLDWQPCPQTNSARPSKPDHSAPQ